MKKIVLVVGLMAGMCASWAFSVHEYDSGHVRITFDTWAENAMWKIFAVAEPDMDWAGLVCMMWLAGFRLASNNSVTVFNSADGFVTFTLWEGREDNRTMHLVDAFAMTYEDWEGRIQTMGTDRGSYTYIIAAPAEVED